MAAIWIVEDDPKIGLLIEMTVRKTGHAAVRMPDAVALERALKKQVPPDLLLLDLMLREKNGFAVIIISARSAEHDKVMGLELGAEDYITKPFGVRELQARVQAALRRLPASVEKLCVGALTLLPATREAYVDGNRVDLTQKEFELLLYLARHADSTVTRAMLVRDIWGYATEEDNSRTVDSHIKTLRLKLGDAACEPRFIQTVRGTGYRLMRGEQP